ncbi:MAG: hypothetical protein EOP33_02810 [Rickettsiaceae bacterium]|nr:MAG: hypothetical protein EOP33_02810 [Rickettsiaceae bacterium]
MRKFVLILLPLLLIGCDNLGSKKIKTTTELTNKLILESSEPVIVQTQELREFPFFTDLNTHKAYKLSDKKISSAPVFAQGNIYAVDDSGTAIAFSKADKKILWTRNISNKKLDRNYIGGGIAYSNDRLFITNGSRFLTIINSKTGHQLAKREFSDIIRIRPTIIDHHTVLVQTIDNHVYAYDFHQDKFLWQHEDVSETLISSTRVAPIIYNSNALISYNSGRTVSLDLKNGNENWNLNLFQKNSNNEDVSLPNFELSTSSCDPVIENDNVYVANQSGIITKINLSTGQILWQIQADDVQSMIVEGNSLFVTNNAKQIAAISTNVGKVKWLAELGDLSPNKSNKRKSMHFLKPIVNKTPQGFMLSILASDANIYSFEFDNKNHQFTRSITVKGLKNMNYANATCCGETYIITDKYVVFAENNKESKTISNK